jgi:hypothetical protein
MSPETEEQRLHKAADDFAKRAVKVVLKRDPDDLLDDLARMTKTTRADHAKAVGKKATP